MVNLEAMDMNFCLLWLRVTGQFQIASWESILHKLRLDSPHQKLLLLFLVTAYLLKILLLHEIFTDYLARE
jgi:hypothetical protein